MAEHILTEFSISEATANEDIRKLLKIIKPQWDESVIEIKPLSGGYSCSMYKALSKLVPNDAVTVKIRNVLADMALPGIDRNLEGKVIQVMSKRGIFPKVYAILKNGYCYQYAEGKALFNIRPEIIKTDLTKEIDYEKFPLQLIAEKYAKVHCTKLEDEDMSKTDFFTNFLAILADHYPNVSSSILVDKQVVRKEFTKLMEYSKNFKFNIVLCHGNCHPGNTVWNEEKNEVMFVDWETTTIGLQAFDVAYFLSGFTESVFVNLNGFSSVNEAVVAEIKKKFIRLYLTEYSKLNNFELTKEYVIEFEGQVKFCTLVWYLAMVIYTGPVYIQMTKCPNLERVSTLGVDSFQRYLSVKDRVLAELKLT